MESLRSHVYPVNVRLFSKTLKHFLNKTLPCVGKSVGNCNTPNSSKQKEARVITLTLHMLICILCLPVEDTEITLAEILRAETKF